MKRGIVFLLCMAMWWPVVANNVRIVKEPDIAVAAITDGIALIEMDIAWDNSWRDEFNWDAVYIFLKYKRKTETAWKHVYLMDGGHAIGSSGFEFQMAKSGTEVNKCMGIFIQRSRAGSGSVSRLSLKLRWLLSTNGLGQVDFFNDEVEYQASCIEMVYVPMGAFCLGDGISEKTFERHHRPILPEWDCLSLDTSKMEYLALGNQVSNDYRAYPPENAANRVNNASDLANAWRSSEAGKTFWQVHFKDRPRTIRYFGVSGLSGGYARPDTWRLNGSKDGKSWTTLWQGKSDAWYIGSKSYPVQYALEVEADKVGAYSYYQIEVVTGSGYMVANNIAMTEVDLKQMTNDAFVVDRADGIVMDMETNLSAKDGDTWSGTLQANYPTGFNSFYAMKYEISQEQWVRFLNKLEYNQQKQRTVGDRLDGLAVGKYVYGSTCRNGIAIGSRDKGSVVFVNNLTNDAGNAIAQEDDGQTIACNYLSPADMLAYADWCGLRPLSEMEYEKMARPPYPALPYQKEWAGGDPALLVKPLASGLTDARKVTERINPNNGRHVNVNAGNTLGGPVRVGATAVGANNRTEAGAGFWGCLDLSGNLAEIYYACNYNSGRNFHDILQAHGDGALVANTTIATAGNTNMSTSYWPQDPKAFILRGGHFQSQRDDELAISNRSKYGCFSNLNAKDSLSTFRLGHSVSKLNPAVSVPKTYLTLVNGSTSVSNGSAKDSVCSEAPYLIRGTDVTKLPEYDGGRYSYIWYKSENGGTNWEIIQGEEGCNLTYRDFFNGSGKPIAVLFKRRTLTPTWADDTKYVEIKVINTGYTFNRLRDTITMANHVLGYWVDTKTSAQFIWKWRSDKGDVLLHATKGQTIYDYYAPLRRQYGSQIKGKQRLVCEMNFMGRCVKKQELELVIVPRPTDGVASTNIAINASKPEYECGAVMKDVRTNTGKPELYKTVRIGDQCWMAENLRYPMGGNTRTSEQDPTGEITGLYYHWNSVAQQPCPAGWRVPLHKDFAQLIAYVEQLYGGNAGIHLKQGAYWNYTAGKQYLGDNRTGFGMPGGGYYNHYWYGYALQAYSGNDGFGNHYTTYSYFGTADNYYFYTYYGNGSITYSWYWSSGYGYYFPIRCIKN